MTLLLNSKQKCLLVCDGGKVSGGDNNSGIMELFRIVAEPCPIYYLARILMDDTLINPSLGGLENATVAFVCD